MRYIAIRALEIIGIGIVIWLMAWAMASATLPGDLMTASPEYIEEMLNNDRR